MKRFVVLAAVTAVSCATAAGPVQPLRSGEYSFVHRFAEHPHMPSVRLTGRIDGNRIVLANQEASSAFPIGVVTEGTLMWHPGSRQWIVGKSERDRDAPEVGGCTDGPEVVDLQSRTYWTC